MKKENGISHILYLYLHSKIYEKFGNETTEKQVKQYLYNWKIPKELKLLVIKEMEMLCLIEYEGRNKILVKRSDFNIAFLNKYYEGLGFFS